jgi:DNA-binding PadR family transcriptional regulator
MKLPPLTHLQFAVLSCLGTNKISGRELRAALVHEGVKKSAPSFYQLMARLEDADFVKGDYESKAVHGQTIKERVYWLTATGSRVRQDQYAYYYAHAPAPIGSPAF